MGNTFKWYRYRSIYLSDAIVDTVLYVWHNKLGIHLSGTDIEALADENVLSDAIVDTVLHVYVGNTFKWYRYILNASKKATFTVQPYSIFNVILSF